MATAAARVAVMRVFCSVVIAMALVAAMTAVVVMVPPESAAAVMAAASPAGAACTEFAETAPTIAAAESATPLLVKNWRSFSTARFTRMRAASSRIPNDAPTCCKSLPSKYRSTTASCSFLPRQLSASSSNGAIWFQGSESDAFSQRENRTDYFDDMLEGHVGT